MWPLEIIVWWGVGVAIGNNSLVGVAIGNNSLVGGGCGHWK